jgi:hypothetical protein
MRRVGASPVPSGVARSERRRNASPGSRDALTFLACSYVEHQHEPDHRRARDCEHDLSGWWPSQTPVVRARLGCASGRRGRSGRRPDPTRWIARRERVKTRLIDNVPVLRCTRHLSRSECNAHAWAVVAATHALIPEHGDHSVVSRGEEMIRPASSSVRSDLPVVRRDRCPARLSRVAATSRPNVRSDAPSSSRRRP